VIHAWCIRQGDVATRTALATLSRERRLAASSTTTRDLSGFVSEVSAFAHASPVGAGHRVGRPPLPYVSIEHAPHGGLAIERGGFGGRPAYVRCERDLVLASTDLTWVVDTARALGVRWSSSSLDPDRLAAECTFDAGEVGHTQTLLRGVREIPPGTRAVLVPERMLLTPLEPPRPMGEPGAYDVASLRALLLAATERALEGASHIGVLTGGGLDSGALLAMAASLGARVDAFAIDFEGPGDDRPHLAALASALGIEPVKATPSGGSLPADLTAAGLPLTWPSAYVEALLLKRALGSGASRVLAGLGADEWFDGDPDAASLLLRSSMSPGLRAAVAAARGYEQAGLRRALGRVLWPRLRREVPFPLRRLTRRARVRPTFPEWAGPRTKRVMSEAHERALADKPWIELTAEERILSGFRDPHLARTSTLRLQLERLSGVLRVDPYLDAELATFALGASPELLLGQNEPRERRGLFREALAGLVPEALRTRQDKASFVPVHHALFQRPHLATLERAARVTHLGDLEIVEPSAFRKAFDEAVAGAAGQSEEADRGLAQLYAVLAVEAFLSAW
jgi:asparagine synthetase B (glutamine-hydrolysing)